MQVKERNIKGTRDALNKREREVAATKQKLDKDRDSLSRMMVAASPPPYWSTCSLDLKSSVHLVEASTSTKQHVQDLMTNTCIKKHIGRGRDSHKLKHTGFRVTRVQRVENAMLWKKYHLEREAVVANMPRPPPQPTTVDTYHSDLWKELQIREDANEALLWHGTKASLSDLITKQGLDERTASNGFFGHGIYFAENSSKSDE